MFHTANAFAKIPFIDPLQRLHDFNERVRFEIQVVNRDGLFCRILHPVEFVGARLAGDCFKMTQAILDLSFLIYENLPERFQFVF